MRITIIGIDYAPEVAGIAPYTTGVAEGLAELGHEVNVITGLPHYPEWRVAKEYEGRAPFTEQIAGVAVHRVPHYVPHPPSPRGRIRMEASFARRVTLARWFNPSVVLTVSPTLLSAAGVVAAARARRIPVGVIVQDLYGRGVVETGAMQGRTAAGVTRLEVGMLRLATGTAVIHDRFGDELSRLGVPRQKISVIRNWTHISESIGNDDSAQVRKKYGWRPDEIVVLHTGNMGVKQGLENVVDAGKLAAAQNGAHPRVRFVLVGDGNERRVLARKASGVPTVQMMDPLPADEFREALNAADILLVNERPGVGDMAVPSKLTTYFISEKPVLGAVDARGVAAEEIRAAGGGLIVQNGSPQALLDGARQLGTDEVRMKEMGALNRAYAREVLGRDTAIKNYAQWCEAIVSTPGSA